MKNTHIDQAITALKKQVVKYQSERAKYLRKAEEANNMSKFFEAEITRLNEQIAALKPEKNDTVKDLKEISENLK